MSGAAVQAQLHALVPAWDASVVAARAELGYDPAWWQPEALRWSGARVDPLYADPYWQWIRAHGRALDKLAADTLRALALPAIFEPYWRACFFTLQPERGLASVREFVNGRVRRAYPIGEVVSTSVRTPGDGSEPFVEIRAPLRYASQAVMDAAVKSVLPFARRMAGPDGSLAALAEGRLRKTAAARMGRVTRNDPLRARTRELAAMGLLTGEIVDTLQAEFGAGRPDWTISNRTVQRWRRSGGDIL